MTTRPAVRETGSATRGSLQEAVWRALASRTVVELLGVDRTHGLSDAEAARRLQRVGANALPEARSTPVFLLFLRQYKRPLVDLLLAAGALAFALGHRTDAWVILAIVTANASLGAFQEGRAERAIPALRRLATSTARVVHTWIGNRRLRSTPLSAELVIRHARLERSPPAVPERSALAAAPGGG